MKNLLLIFVIISSCIYANAQTSDPLSFNINRYNIGEVKRGDIVERFFTIINAIVIADTPQKYYKVQIAGIVKD